MKVAAVLTLALGLCAAGCLGSRPRQPQPAAGFAEIYRRATNVFEYADFFKPAETGTNDLSFRLAPLILQQVAGAKEAVHPLDRFGTLTLLNGAPVLDVGRPAVYWEADTVRINGKIHARFSYLWFYAIEPGGHGRSQAAGATAPGDAEAGLAAQGIRITLNSAGAPAIWEVLEDRSGAKVLFVSDSLEAAAVAEFRIPLAGGRNAIEGSAAAAAEVKVARVIADGPVAMGPIVYLSAGTRAVSTLICRCMPAQARKLVSSGTYELLPWNSAAAVLLATQADAVLKRPAAFWPGEPAREGSLERCLRLPRNF